MARDRRPGGRKALTGRAMKWITRDRPKTDRLACPWLIRRFIDSEPEFRFVPASDVLAEAKRTGAIPFDVPGAALRRVGELTSFDALLTKYEIDDPALDLLAVLVRHADTGRTDLAPQSAGLLAISYGLSRSVPDDSEMMRHAFAVYDALYHWCRKAPAGPDFAARRSPARSAADWRGAIRLLHSDRRVARALTALNKVTLAEVFSERADFDRVAR